MSNKHNSTLDFDAFVKRQQAGSGEEEVVDWAKERDEWLRYLNELYEQIKLYLAEYIKAGEIKYAYRDIQLKEENIGSYTAPSMIVKVGRQEIVLTPVGTLLVGAKGRVEALGPGGRARIVLVDSESSGPRISVNVSGSAHHAAIASPKKEIKWAWKILTSPPTISYIELTQDSLFRMLLEVANG